MVVGLKLKRGAGNVRWNTSSCNPTPSLFTSILKQILNSTLLVNLWSRTLWEPFIRSSFIVGIVTDYPVLCNLRNIFFKQNWAAAYIFRNYILSHTKFIWPTFKFEPLIHIPTIFTIGIIRIALKQVKF